MILSVFPCGEIKKNACTNCVFLNYSSSSVPTDFCTYHFADQLLDVELQVNIIKTLKYQDVTLCAKHLKVT